MLSDQQITDIILSLLRNESPDTSELIKQLSGACPTSIHAVASAFTNLRSHSDRPLSKHSFEQFLMVSECIFEVYIKFCDRLLTEKQERAQQGRKTSEAFYTPSITNIASPTPVGRCGDPTFADMNILLNSLRTYFMLTNERKLYASEALRGHKLFTSHILWRGLFHQALSEQNLEECDENMAFMLISAQIVVYVHLMRAFGLVEEDVRLWVQYFINSSSTLYHLNQAQVSNFYEQIESVFSSADSEENELPLLARNNIVRVAPNYSGYRAVYVNPDRLKRKHFEEEPLFNCEQEQLLKELTTMMSEPVEMKKISSDDVHIKALTRQELINKIWGEKTELQMYDEAVPIGQANELNDMIEQYLNAIFEPKTEEESEWDDESSQEHSTESTCSIKSYIGKELSGEIFKKI
ncbi:Conserved_hypothetical protein [Hexamita inflata]|uniref:Uncharacterized protein n=1 Tax=Hexamita inflata TaxID=28002 RepID=A0AA86UYD6_9EUKA|nr:Conserved hypothetical protein [Hexamita inflata]